MLYNVNVCFAQFLTLETDAAHVHSPTGGQGLNTSVGDSVGSFSN